MPKLTQEEQERRLELYNKGYNDREIGEILYYAPTVITMWRQRNGLPPVNGKNWRHREITTKEEHERRMELYRQGYSDRKIAKILGNKSGSMVYNWRVKHNLPPNNNSWILTKEEHEKRMQLIREGKNDTECGIACGISASTFGIWRRRNGIPANCKKGYPKGRRRKP